MKLSTVSLFISGAISLMASNAFSATMDSPDTQSPQAGQFQEGSPPASGSIQGQEALPSAPRPPAAPPVGAPPPTVVNPNNTQGPNPPNTQQYPGGVIPGNGQQPIPQPYGSQQGNSGAAPKSGGPQGPQTYGQPGGGMPPGPQGKSLYPSPTPDTTPQGTGTDRSTVLQ